MSYLNEYFDLHIYSTPNYIEIRADGDYPSQCLLCGQKLSKRFVLPRMSRTQSGMVIPAPELTNSQKVDIFKAFLATNHIPVCPSVIEARKNPKNIERVFDGRPLLINKDSVFKDLREGFRGCTDTHKFGMWWLTHCAKQPIFQEGDYARFIGKQD